jgi:hypothetical protein
VEHPWSDEERAEGSNRNMGLDLRELLLHRGDGVPCVGAHAGCSQSRQGSMHLFPFCAQQSHRYRQTIVEARTHLDGLAGLRSGLIRLGLGFHIASRVCMEGSTSRAGETDWGWLVDFILFRHRESGTCKDGYRI